MKKKEKDSAEFDVGLGGIFKGIGSVLDFVAEMEKKGLTEVKKEGTLGKDFKAVYGFSVKFAGEGKPTEKDEMRRLKKKLADISEENKILKKALAIFSKQQNQNTK